MVNKVTLIGNLGQDPEIKTLESGTKVARFSLATNENYKDKQGEWQQRTEWHNVVAWRYNADKAERLSKGDQVFVSGKINYRKYTDSNNVEKYITDIVAREIRQLGRPDSDSSGRIPSEETSTKGMDPFDKKISDGGAKSGGGASDAEADDDLPF